MIRLLRAPSKNIVEEAKVPTTYDTPVEPRDRFNPASVLDVQASVLVLQQVA